MARIIVIGVTHHNTLGLVRCLGLAGYKTDIIIIGSPCSYIAQSKYVNNVYYVHSEELIVGLLVKNYSNSQEKPIIFSCTDKVESVLDSHYDLLTKHFHFFNAGSNGCVTKFMDKQNQVDLARSVGLRFPESEIYTKGTIPNKYPCILKPLKSINGGKNIAICNNKKEFFDNINKFQDNDTIQLQQYIVKDYEIVVLGVSLGHVEIIPGYIRKYRDFDGGTLYSAVCPINQLPNEVIKRCKSFIKATHYEGLFGIEFIKNNDEYYFIEANLRNDATTYSLAVAGVNLPDIYIKSKLGKSTSDTIEVKSINSIVEFNDYKHRKSLGIPLWIWLKQFLQAKCKYYFNIRDIKPFFYAPLKNK